MPQYGRINMPDLDTRRRGIGKSRRHLIKAGVIGASAILAHLSKLNQATRIVDIMVKM
jgi:hypothetical protein